MKIADIKFYNKKKDKDVRKSTDFKRQGQLIKVAKKFCNSETDIDESIFSQPDFAEQYVDWIKENYSLNTQISYARLIIGLANHTSSITVPCIKKLKSYIDDIGNVESSTHVDEHYSNKLDDAYGKHGKAIDMIITIVRHVGAIRLFELINTKVRNRDDNLNFLDMDNYMWYFSKKSTKTGFERSFPVSPKAINAIKEHLWADSEYLILGKNFQPYTKTNSITQLFKAATGITYGVVRKSYIELSNNDKDANFIVNLANVMGHKTNTQLTSYSNTPPLGCIITELPSDVIDAFKNEQPIVPHSLYGKFYDVNIAPRGHSWSKDNHIREGISDNLLKLIRKHFPDLDTDQLSIEYRCDTTNTTLPFHVDDHCYDEPIYMICLEGEYVLSMLKKGELQDMSFVKYMLPGDCVKLVGDARKIWQHGIGVMETKTSAILRLSYVIPDKPMIMPSITPSKQCIAITKAGKQCSKYGSPLNVYCTVHAKIHGTVKPEPVPVKDEPKKIKISIKPKSKPKPKVIKIVKKEKKTQFCDEGKHDCIITYPRPNVAIEKCVKCPYSNFKKS